MPRTEQDTAMRQIVPPGGSANSVDSSLDDSETSAAPRCDYRFSAAPWHKARPYPAARVSRGLGPAAVLEAGMARRVAPRFAARVRYNLETIRWVTPVGHPAGNPRRTMWWGDLSSLPPPIGHKRCFAPDSSGIHPAFPGAPASGKPQARRRGGTKILHTEGNSCRYNGWKHRRELAPRLTP